MESRILYFLIINGVIFILVLIYSSLKKKKAATIVEIENKLIGVTPEINTEYYKQTKGTNKDYKNIPLINVPGEITDPSRPMNVVFTWNGHDWDAYEVLGIPAGSSLDEVKAAYEDALSKVDHQSQKIIEKAYNSICQKVS